MLFNNLVDQAERELIAYKTSQLIFKKENESPLGYEDDVFYDASEEEFGQNVLGQEEYEGQEEEEFDDDWEEDIGQYVLGQQNDGGQEEVKAEVGDYGEDESEDDDEFDDDWEDLFGHWR